MSEAVATPAEHGPPRDTQPERLVEHVTDWRAEGVEVDRTSRLVRGVALTGTRSKNGYRYSEQALREAARLYDHKPVFLDHAPRVTRPHERSTRDLVGSVLDARFENDRLRGDVRVLDTEAGRTFLALAEANGPAVGMSHVVLAERNADRSVVHRIHDVVSIDAVVFPATTSSFREQEAHLPPADESTSLTLPHPAWPGSLEALLLEVDALLPGHLGRFPDVPSTPTPSVRRAGLFPHSVLAEVRANDDTPPRRFSIEWSRDGQGHVFLGEPAELDTDANPQDVATESDEWLSPRLAALLRERDDLRRRLDEARAQCRTLERQHAVRELLREADLPDFAVTGAFREQLEQAPNEADRRRLIHERRELVDRCRARSPSSHPRRGSAAVSDHTLVAALKRTSRRAA